MTTEIVCALITVFGVILSALISYRTSRRISKDEIQKLTMTWSREDSLSISKDLEDLTQLVYDFIDCENNYFSIPALSKLASIRAKETGPVSILLDELSDALNSRDLLRRRYLLPKIVEQYRESKRDAQNPKRKKPKKN